MVGTGASDTTGRDPDSGGSAFSKVMLSAQFRDMAQVDAFFDHVPRWQIDRLVILPLDWIRGNDFDFWHGIVGPLHHWRSFPFGASAMPGLASRRDALEVQVQLDVMDAVYRHCIHHRVEFMPSIVLPKFVFNDREAVRQGYPQLFAPDGRFNLESSAYLPMLEAVLDEMRQRYPEMAGFELRFSEGSSANIRQYELHDLERLEAWLPLWTTFGETYAQQHGLEMMVFAHHYHSSRATRKRLHALLGRHPSLWVLEDLTWPEEHVTLPPLGYLGEEWARALASSNPLCVNFLLDAEYMGQGRLPSVLPRWWQVGMRQSRAVGASGVIGRTMRWDRFDTLNCWNLHNVDLFCALARDLDIDTSDVLKDSLERRFGKGPAIDELVAMLEESERLFRLQTMNGIDFTDHSGFPPPAFLHRAYFGKPLAMQTVNDLFSPPGTALHVETTDDLTADREWRQQLKTVARHPDDYVREKTVLVAEVQRLSERAMEIAGSLAPDDGSFVTKSYSLWAFYARALELFTRIAVAHQEWIATGCGDDARRRLVGLGAALESLAAEVEKIHGHTALFDLASRLRSMARFLDDPPPVDLR